MQDEIFDLFLVGGVFKAGRPVLGPLQAELRSRAPKARKRKPRLPPAVGAVLMALDAAGIPIGPRQLRRLPSTLS
jgi:hypothetical protein